MPLIGSGLIRCHFTSLNVKTTESRQNSKKIREMRKLKGFSQKDFAAEAGLGRTYYGRVERGEQNISIQNLIQIAITIHVEIGELLPPLKQFKKLR